MKINEKEIDFAPIFEMIKNGERIQAIQYVIEQTGISLKEAYEVVQTEIEKFGSFILSTKTKKNNSPSTDTKRLNFKYSNDFYTLWIVGMFVIYFGVSLMSIILLSKIELGLGDWKPAVIASMLLICLIVSMFAAERFSAIITENDGEVIFRETYLEFILKEQNILIEYNKVARIEFEKIVGSTDGWSFTPIGIMKIFLANGRKIKILSSRREAQKMKKELGLVWKYKLNKDGSAPVQDVLLWKVCVELSERTGQTICEEKIIEKSD